MLVKFCAERETELTISYPDIHAKNIIKHTSEFDEKQFFEGSLSRLVFIKVCLFFIDI